MDESSVNLHYAMLEYLHDKQAIAESCFNHVWEKFRARNREIQHSADELKTIFWRDIIPNIVEYELLTVEMTDYFSQENLFLDVHDENFFNTLQFNEPKAGKDFTVYKPTEVDDANDNRAVNAEPLATIAKKTYKNNFGWDTDSEDDTASTCIKIKVGMQAPSLEYDKPDDSMDKFLSKILTATLRLNTEELLPMQETLELLKDEDVLTKPEELKGLPRGIQKFMAQFAYFKDTDERPPIGPTPLTTRRRPKSSIFEVPNISSSSDSFEPQTTSSPLVEIGNSPARMLRSSLSTSTGPRSKPGQERTHNTRMDLWMQKMKTTKKRLRDSTSPTSPEPK